MPQAETFNQGPRNSKAARLYRLVCITSALPLLVIYLLSTEKDIIRQDCERWMELLHVTGNRGLRALLYLLGQYPEFRTLYYYRVWHGNLLAAGALLILRRYFKAEATLHLRSPNIGPGFFTQHGYATSVGAYKIGKNCSVNQLVVIGWTDRTRGPILGDNVSVKAGAKVLGPITIGDNVVIGANAVVTKDVPANCVVAGVPARIIRRNGLRVNEPLPSKTHSEDRLSSSLLSLNENGQIYSTSLDRDVTAGCRGSSNGIPQAERTGSTV